MSSKIFILREKDITETFKQNVYGFSDVKIQVYSMIFSGTKRGLNPYYLQLCSYCIFLMSERRKKGFLMLKCLCDVR